MGANWIGAAAAEQARRSRSKPATRADIGIIAVAHSPVPPLVMSEVLRQKSGEACPRMTAGCSRRITGPVPFNRNNTFPDCLAPHDRPALKGFGVKGYAHLVCGGGHDENHMIETGMED